MLQLRSSKSQPNVSCIWRVCVVILWFKWSFPDHMHSWFYETIQIDYKEELGKSFSKKCFYLCLAGQFNKTGNQGNNSDLSQNVNNNEGDNNMILTIVRSQLMITFHLYHPFSVMFLIMIKIINFQQLITMIILKETDRQ